MSETSKFSILIVDDEKSNIRVLNHILRPQYTIYTAKDGQTAIETAKEYTPDLILLDVIMPGMTGYDVLIELKNTDVTRNIPIVFITGLNSTENEEKGFLLGAVDYITKPFNNTIVKVRVRQHLQTVKQLRTIEKMGMLDPLLEIPNRRGFNNKLETEWNRAMHKGTPISVLMMDLDQFKIYNDTYGHLQGDLLLQTMAEIFQRELTRPEDFVARWGGDEFAALLPNTELGEAVEIAERICKNAGDAVITLADGSGTQTTVSVGAYTQVPTPGCTVEAFLSEADKALYEAKALGRNRVFPQR